MEPLHRDDLPMDVAEQVVARIQEQFPGMRVVFAGDHPGDLPDGVKRAIESLNWKMSESMTRGICMDCGAAMEGYPAFTKTPEGYADFPGDWRPQRGWRHFADTIGGKFSHWQCAECDRQEETHS